MGGMDEEENLDQKNRMGEDCRGMIEEENIDQKKRRKGILEEETIIYNNSNI